MKVSLSHDTFRLYDEIDVDCVPRIGDTCYVQDVKGIVSNVIWYPPWNRNAVIVEVK